MENNNISIIILAAGKGKRMASDLPKVLHPLLGKPMIYYVVETALHLKPLQIIPVLSYKKEEVEKALTENFGYIFDFAYQKEPEGTADAVKTALKHINDRSEKVLILSGDVPLIKADLLYKILQNHIAELTIVTTHIENPSGYGRVVRDTEGRVIKIVEEKDADNNEKLIKEINTGIYCFSRQFLEKYIPKITKNKITGEYYLTDIISLAVRDNIKINSFLVEEGESLIGINNRIELYKASLKLKKELIEKLMIEGVTFIDPTNVYIESTVIIERDSVIHPNAFLAGNTHIGANTVIEQGAVIIDSKIGSKVKIKPYTVIEQSEIHDEAVIGPFAHLRPESVIHSKAKIGNFVETKKSTIKSGAKANHLAYIGDALVEENVNIGAGAITCNYDGEKKHFTHIKKGAFIGTNTSLVAPIVIGENAVTGAGSVITKDIPDGALGVERAEMKIILNWHKIKKRLKK
ncbi:MAG: bifunctional UDP-N-acetylglucosamine diphosphorylase/glucosamine-1-phosphate N-acetyltransferase GlmU [Proteobacteria bacterium]|nr:bifunctional UDP-N-acetylglucosamine diphosphorylase/glucosamine-1-phosphate N-acetyltransferase GlmU [Pseudomonadota bacterium]